MSHAQLDLPAAVTLLTLPSEDRPPRVAVVASLTSSLVNFRLELLRTLVQRGCVVHAFAPEEDVETIDQLRAIGVKFTRIPMARAAQSPLEDLATLSALVRGFRLFRPDIVLPYTMKPIIYGGLAARLTRVPHRFALVTGLGYVFIARTRSVRTALLRWLSVRLYRLALRGVERVFVYNDADAAELRTHAIVGDHLISPVPGSGVDTTRFAEVAIPPGPPVFLMIARLLRHKGVFEFAAAAKILRRRYPQARFKLLGPFDPNPSAISHAEVNAWVADGSLEYLGETRDVRPYLASCSVFVLPSYGEGLSRTVLEAMSTGRAVVTTDGPGCAEPVEEGMTGFVVPVRNAEALTAAMEKFVTDPSLIAKMGAAGRRRVEENYDVRAINRILLAGMGLDRPIASVLAGPETREARVA